MPLRNPPGPSTAELVDERGDVGAGAGSAGVEWAEVAQQLNSGAIHVLRALARADAESGLTPARLSALSVVVFGGACSMTDLARAEGVSAPTMTRLVDALEAAGLVRRHPDPVNGRALRVEATAAGRRLVCRARDRRVGQLTLALQSLPVQQRRSLAAAAPALVALAAELRGPTARHAPAATPRRSVGRMG